MFRLTRSVFSQTITGLLFTGLSGMASSQAPLPNQQGIYTCVDARNRKLTSDRPIPECADREQRVLNPSGTLKAKLTPAITPQEQSELEARERATFEERTRLNEEKRRDRALLIRYPDKVAHDRERTTALTQTGASRQLALARINELMQQRENAQKEMEFYKKDPAKTPLALRRQVDEISQNLTLQNRFVADQDTAINRINARFDDELTRLASLWAPQSVPQGKKQPPP